MLLPGKQCKHCLKEEIAIAGEDGIDKTDCLSWFNSRNYGKANLFTSQLSTRRRDCRNNDDDDGVFWESSFLRKSRQNEAERKKILHKSGREELFRMECEGGCGSRLEFAWVIRLSLNKSDSLLAHLIHNNISFIF
jgi:hypothetical protein